MFMLYWSLLQEPLRWHATKVQSHLIIGRSLAVHGHRVVILRLGSKAGRKHPGRIKFTLNLHRWTKTRRRMSIERLILTEVGGICLAKSRAEAGRVCQHATLFCSDGLHKGELLTVESFTESDL